ncbi:MAG: ABC transporter permease [Pseudomonadota bacterium]
MSTARTLASGHAGRLARAPALRLVRRYVAVGPVITLLWFGFVLLFMLAPLIVVAGASFSGPDRVDVGQGTQFYIAHSYVRFPPENLTLDWYRIIPAAQFKALSLSLALAFGAALLACVLGVPAAFGLVRGRFPGKTLVAALFRAPMQIPAVVTGIAFLQLYYSVGDWVDVSLQASYAGMLIAHVFLATPFVVGTIGAILQRFNKNLEEAALSLGASRWRTFRRVTLPVIMPGVYAGALYGFMVSFGDVPVSMFLGGSGMATYPVELFYSMEGDFNPSALASATVVMTFCLFMLLVVQRIIGLENLLRSSGGR